MQVNTRKRYRHSEKEQFVSIKGVKKDAYGKTKKTSEQDQMTLHVDGIDLTQYQNHNGVHRICTQLNNLGHNVIYHNVKWNKVTMYTVSQKQAPNIGRVSVAITAFTPGLSSQTPSR